MVSYVCLAKSKRSVNNDIRSWKYYVFVLIGLLVLIPVAMMFFTSVLKKNKIRILSIVSRIPHRSFLPNKYELPETTGKVRDNTFDFLIFTQLYPITGCIIRYSSMDKCHFAPDWEAWTVHGIWPSSANETGPQYCKRETFNVSALDSIKNELDIHWYSNEPNGNTYFWKHEWLKHGSCAEQLEILDSELKYFSQGLAWNKQFNINDMLEAHGIVPNNSKSYKVEDFENAIEAYIGAEAIICCVLDKKNNVSLISEIRLCFTKNKDLETCDHIAAVDLCPSNELIYPESSYLTIPEHS